MGKKKRQGDPSRDDCASTDSEDGGQEEKSFSSCPHVGKAANLGAIKKTLKIAWVKVGQCSACLKETTKVSAVRKTENPRVKAIGTKLSLAEIKKEQLERAKAEQRVAAEKLKKEREVKERLKQEEIIEKEEDVEEIEAHTTQNVPDLGKTEESIKKDDEESTKGGAVVSAPSIWLCLKCGSQGCGENSRKHSRAHHQVPRSAQNNIFCWNYLLFILSRVGTIWAGLTTISNI